MRTLRFILVVWLVRRFCECLQAEVPVDLALDYKRTCILFANGKVKCFGNNDNGQLGLGNTRARGEQCDDVVPFVDFGGRKVKQICAGRVHNCVLLEKTGSNGLNEVVCFGHDCEIHRPLGRGRAPNANSCMGFQNVGDDEHQMGNSLRPVRLEGSPIALSCGENHTCAIVANGREKDEIRCWGRNNQVKLGSKVLHAGEIHHGPYGDCMINSIPPVNLGNDLQVVQVTAGSYNTCALFANGKVKCWGAGALSGLETNAPLLNATTDVVDLPYVNFGEHLTPVKLVSKYSGTCVVLKTVAGNTGLKCFGFNVQNVLGVGMETAPVFTNNQQNGTIGDKSGEMGSNLPYVPLGTNVNVHDVALGRSHTCVILSDAVVKRQLKCYGNGGFGQLGYESAGSIYYASEMGRCIS